MGSSFPLLILAVLLVALVLSWWSSEAAKLRRALRAARRVPIAEVREGEVVRVTGRVRGAALDLLRANGLHGLRG